MRISGDYQRLVMILSSATSMIVECIIDSMLMVIAARFKSVGFTTGHSESPSSTFAVTYIILQSP